MSACKVMIDPDQLSKTPRNTLYQKYTKGAICFCFIGLIITYIGYIVKILNKKAFKITNHHVLSNY